MGMQNRAKLDLTRGINSYLCSLLSKVGKSVSARSSSLLEFQQCVAILQANLLEGSFGYDLFYYQHTRDAVGPRWWRDV